MSIKRIYFEIFADSIEAAAKNGRLSKREQPLYILIVFSLAQFFNINLLLLLLTELDINTHIYLEINVFPGGNIDAFLSSFLTLILPLCILNYFIVFHNNTYLKYTENRKIKMGGWALFIYFMGSAILYIGYVVVGKMIMT
jgi:hypothetical protein